jgi:CBS domain-containing protein
MSHSVQFQEEVVTVRPYETIRHVVQLMREHAVGAVVVVNAKEEPVGIVTDRDVALAVVTERCDPETSVCFIMSADPITIDENDDVAADAERKLQQHVPAGT